MNRSKERHPCKDRLLYRVQIIGGKLIANEKFRGQHSQCDIESLCFRAAPYHIGAGTQIKAALDLSPFVQHSDTPGRRKFSRG